LKVCLISGTSLIDRMKRPLMPRSEAVPDGAPLPD
jgi:hypothetical protein